MAASNVGKTDEQDHPAMLRHPALTLRFANDLPQRLMIDGTNIHGMIENLARYLASRSIGFPYRIASILNFIGSRHALIPT